MRVTGSVAIGLMLAGSMMSVLNGQTVTVLSEAPGKAVWSAEPILSRPARLRIHDVSLILALEKLADRSGVGIAFSPSLLDSLDVKVRCDCADVTVARALDQLLSATALTYSVLDNQVVITPRPDRGPLEPARFRDALAQTRIVTGRVLDSLTNEPVTSGQISVTGTTLGTTIKEDGTFTLTVPGRSVTLTVRSIGFKRKDVPVAANERAIQIALARDYFQMEAIVVTGQATGIERKNLANAVASISADQLSRAPTGTVEQSLMGKVASAQIQDLGGGPGGGVLVTLRGSTSLNNAYTPLYVVDGVIVSNARVPRGINQLTEATGSIDIATDEEQPVNRIADLNPDNIEHVEVLKGAAASAIYGSKASNGVILITTKSGRIGAPQFTVSQRFGTSKMFRPVGYRIFETQQEAVDAFGPSAGQRWGATVYNHDQEVAGRLPLHFETGISVSGGTETTRYFASGLVRHEGGIIDHTYSDKQSLRLNLDQTLGTRLRFNVSSEVVHNANNRGITGNGNNGVSYYDALTTTPSFVELKALCPDGSRRIKCDGGVYPFNPYANSNPLATIALVKNDEDVYRGIVSARAALDVVTAPQHQLQFLVNGGVDNFNQKNVVFSPPELQYEALDGLLGTSVLSFGSGINANLNGNVVYTFKPLSGNLTATTSAGVQLETSSLQVGRTLAEGLVNGLQITTAGTAIKIDETHEQVKDLGFFAQEEVLIKDRLLLTVGGRADQSSNNNDPGQLFVYPKASASYRVSPRSTLASELKFRVALGASGNRPNYRTKFSELQAGNIAGVAGTEIATTVSALDIRPERQRELEAGVDATLLNSRANLEVTVYDKRISDLLLRRSLPPVTGYQTQIFNGGVMRTRGLEVGLNLLPVQSSRVRWNARFNFFLSRSKILELPVPTFRQSGWFVGYGILQIEQGKSPTQVVAWDSLPGGSRIETPIGDYNPDYKLSWANDLSLGKFKLYFLWDHYQGGWIHNFTELLYDFAQNTDDFETLDSNGLMRGLNRIDYGTRNCSACAWMQPMTSTKLREATLSYELPQSVLKRLWTGARYMRVSLSGRNLLILSKYRGGDPEVLVNAETLFTQYRSDIWPYPPFRTFWFSVDLGF